MWEIALIVAKSSQMQNTDRLACMYMYMRNTVKNDSCSCTSSPSENSFQFVKKGNGRRRKLTKDTISQYKCVYKPIEEFKRKKIMQYH